MFASHDRSFGRAMKSLLEVVGLPAATPVMELDSAAERVYLTLFDGASRGDAAAKKKLIELRVAYLNWAYANTLTPRQSSTLARDAVGRQRARAKAR